MTDEEIVANLRRILRPTIDWYRRTLERDDMDEDPRDYLYDTTIDAIQDMQSRGDLQQVIEALL